MCNWILVTRDPSLLACIIRHGFLTTFCILRSFQEYAQWCSSKLLLPFITKQLLIQSNSVKYNVSSLKELQNNTVITWEKQIGSVFIILVLWFFFFEIIIIAINQYLPTANKLPGIVLGAGKYWWTKHSCSPLPSWDSRKVISHLRSNETNISVRLSTVCYRVL